MPPAREEALGGRVAKSVVFFRARKRGVVGTVRIRGRGGGRPCDRGGERRRGRRRYGAWADAQLGHWRTVQNQAYGEQRGGDSGRSGASSGPHAGKDVPGRAWQSGPMVPYNLWALRPIHSMASTCLCNNPLLYYEGPMDPLQAWKDDFNREVEEVLASRARAQEGGESVPAEGFGGRLADMVIPPAGAYAEFRDAQNNLKLAQAEAHELRERLEAKEAQVERERGARERMKDGAVRLAVLLREERAALGAAQDEAKRAWREVEAAGVRLEGARLDADHIAARAEDWEREAMARLRAARGLQTQLERAALDSDAKDAEAASLRARLDAAVRRAQTAEEEFAATRADEASRVVRAEAAERTALASLAALEAEMRALRASSSSREREAQGLLEEISKVREEAVAIQAREVRARLETKEAQDEAKKARREAEEARALLEAARLDADHAAARAEDWEREARGFQAQLDRATLDCDAKETEAASLRARLDAALRRAQTSEAELRSLSASSAAFEHEAQGLVQEIAKAREEAADARAREHASVQALAAERVRVQAEAAAMLERSEAMRAESARSLEAMGHELQLAREEAAGAQAREHASMQALAGERARVQAEAAAMVERSEALRAEVALALDRARRLDAERERVEPEQGQRALEASRRAEAAVSETVRLAITALGEYRGRMREETQRLVGTTQEESDRGAAYRALRESWKDQTEALKRLREDLERGRPGL